MKAPRQLLAARVESDLQARNPWVEAMMTRVLERMYLGSLKDADRLTTDNSIGINTVVSLCLEEVAQTDGIAYINIPIADAQPISRTQFATPDCDGFPNCAQSLIPLLFWRKASRNT